MMSRMSKESFRDGPRVKIDPYTVDKFKRLPGGLNEVAIKIVRDFGLRFDYDKVKDVLEIGGAELDILQIAASSLDFWIEGDVYPASGVSCQVGYPNKGIVIWRFHGDYAVKFNHLFMQDVAELKKIPTVNVKAVPNRRRPTHVEVYCSFTVYQNVRRLVQRIEFEIPRLFTMDFFIPKDDQTKAKQFVKSRQMDSTVLYGLDDARTKNKTRVWIHGRENADVARAKRDWIAHVGMIAAHSSSNDPDNIERLNKTLQFRQQPRDESEVVMKNRRNSTKLQNKKRSLAVSKLRGQDHPNYPRPVHMFFPTTRKALDPIDNEQARNINTGQYTAPGFDPLLTTSPRGSKRLGKISGHVIVEMSTLTKGNHPPSANSFRTSSSKRTIMNPVSGFKMIPEAVINNAKVGNFHMIGGPRVTVHMDENNRPKKHLISHVRNDIPVNGSDGSALPNVRYHSDINGLDIYMYRHSVVKLTEMDVLVNVVDVDLKNGGTLNNAFEEAIGPTLEEERAIYLRTHGPLAVTENYVTSSGKLSCKGVIHAVGPRWKDYGDKEQDCLTDIHTTVYNILKTAEIHQYRKVGIPAISAEAYFGVPKDVCAEMYVLGIVNYCRRMGPLYPVLEIHLVDLNLEMLTCIKDAYESWEANLTTNDTVLPKDFLTVARPMDEKLTERPAHTSQNMVTFKQQTYTSFGEQMWTFDVLRRLTVHVYNGSVVKLSDVDTIVAGLDSNLNGRLAREILEKAGKQYQKSLQNASFRRTLMEGEVLVCDAGDLSMRSVLHAVISQPIRSGSHKNLSRLDHINTQILNTIFTWGMPSVAIPLLGTGRLRERFEIEQCALQLVDNIIEFVLSRGPQLKLKELHLVNVNTVMTQLILQALRTRAHTKIRLESFNELSKIADKPVTPAADQEHRGDANHPSYSHHTHGLVDPSDEAEIEDFVGEMDSGPRDTLQTRRSSVNWSNDLGSAAGMRRNDRNPEGSEWIPTGQLRTGRINSTDGSYLSDRGHFENKYANKKTSRTSRTDPNSSNYLKRTSSQKSYKEVFDGKGNLVDLRPVSESELLKLDDSTDEEWSDRWTENDNLWVADGQDAWPNRQKERNANNTNNTNNNSNNNNNSDRNNNVNNDTRTVVNNDTRTVVNKLFERIDRLTQPLNLPTIQSDPYETRGIYATERVYKTERVYMTAKHVIKHPDKPTQPEHDDKKEIEKEKPVDEKKYEKPVKSKEPVKKVKDNTPKARKANNNGTARSRNTAKSVTTTIRNGTSTSNNSKGKVGEKSAATTRSNISNKAKVQTTIRKTVETTVRKDVQTTKIFNYSDQDLRTV